MPEIADNPCNPNHREIRFINSDYQTLFTIPDGSYITVKRSDCCPDGEEFTRKCVYRDECHTQIGGEMFHICQFAELQERNGATYEPCPAPETVHGYVITDRVNVGEKSFVLAHNPQAAQPWVTWQGRKDKQGGYDWGHYWSDKSTAKRDFFLRHDSARRGVSYDHTTLIKPQQDHDAR